MTSAVAETHATHTYEVVIGLEVHVQLKTETKLFCACSTRFGQEPNTNTCPICLGLPGVLPVLNKQALEYAIKIGHALHCSIAERSKFDRKQYFYPDLPKGYQISQYDLPVCQDGEIILSNGRKVRVLRAHLEEDAGKLNHAGAAGLAGSEYSLVDLNRAGTPLVEIVSEPDIRSSEEAKEYLVQLRNTVRYLGVCDGNLEEGSMRCDANVSLRPVGTEAYGTKAEIKNLNSFKAVQRAIESEIERQTGILNSGGRVTQETRLWNEATATTLPMRSKEQAHDYRYFPEPDLRPLSIDPAWIETLKQTLPELPEARLNKLIQQFGLSEYDAGILVEFKELGDFFETAAAKTQNYKALTNWLMGDVTGYLKSAKKELAETRLTPEHLAELIALVDQNTISSAIAKKLLPEVIESGEAPSTLVEKQGVSQITDPAAIRALIQPVLDANPDNVAAYRSGKDKLFGFFVGQVMKASKGQANPDLINQLLKEMLAS